MLCVALVLLFYIEWLSHDLGITYTLAIAMRVFFQLWLFSMMLTPPFLVLMFLLIHTLEWNCWVVEYVCPILH